MASFILDPGTDIDRLRELQTELAQAIVGSAEASVIDLELGSDARPGHLALQLLASVANTTPAAGRSVRYGPRAAAEIARMIVDKEDRA